jgi:hypothetical protein
MLLADLEGALRRVLHDLGQIPAQHVDVRFDPPTTAFVAALTSPTISFFLFDIRENTNLRHTNLHTTRANGGASHRFPPRRFDLRFMVSVLTTAVEDEHLLLWRTLAALMRYADFPNEILPEGLRGLDPPLSAQVGRLESERGFLDIWQALEAPPRPALLYVVTAPLDLDIAIESPLVLSRTAQFGPVGPPAEPALPRHADRITRIGGVVRSASGNPLVGATVRVEGSARRAVKTDTEGRFALSGVPEGKVTLRVNYAGAAPTLAEVEVPSTGVDAYEILVT